MSYNNCSAPTSPGHQSQQQQQQQATSNNQNSARTNSNQSRRNNSKSSFFGSTNFGSSSGGGGGGGTFDFNQFSQNISNSLQDIFSNNIFNDPLMDVRKMLYKSCNSCGTSFSIFLRKKRCQNCMLHFCHSCMELNHQRAYRCRRCLVFAENPLTKDALNTLRVRDLKWFLSNRNIPSETYSEKRELIELIILHVNPPPPSSSRRSSSASAASHHNSQQQTTSQPQSQRTSPQTEQAPSQPQTPSPSSPLSQPQHTGQPYSSSSNPNLNQAGTNSASPSPHHEPKPTPAGFKLQSSNLNISTFNLNDIKEEAEIKELSIRQLKLILTRNFVDFKGCVEREELIQKAVLLWQDRQLANKFKDENEDNFTIDEQTCKICMENAIDCVLLECGHMLTCTDCGKILSECPVCHQFVTRVVHVFKA